jgi:catechol 2,3-dioxygenase-like lactoylglutathione lyase family enzyme
MRIRSLDHIVLTCAAPEATVAFYERVGMTREEFAGGRLALRFGDQKLNLHQAGAEFRPHAATPLPGTADLCLLVEGSIEAVVERLAEVGITIEEGPVDRTGAIGPLRSVYVRDPDGNLVEFSEQV